jgi:hypothetical protein
MGTPTGAERKLLAAGSRKGAAWGTALALGTTYGLPIKGASGFFPSRDYMPVDVVDQAMVKASYLDVTKPVDATLVADMPYDGGQFFTLLALLMGVAGAPAIQGATTAYLHTLQMADNIWGKFATIALEYPGKIYEAASAKVLGFSLKGGDKIMQAEIKVQANTVIDTSVVNTLTQMDALTYQDRDNVALFRDLAVKINAQSGASVDAETALPNLKNIEVEIGREMESYCQAGGASIIEQVDKGKANVRVKLEFGRFDSTNAAFLAAAIAETSQKMTIAFTSAALAGVGFPYYFKLWLPRLRMLTPVPAWDEVVKNGLELVGEEAAANPTGMAYARPYITIMSKQTTDLLA